MGRIRVPMPLRHGWTTSPTTAWVAVTAWCSSSARIGQAWQHTRQQCHAQGHTRAVWLTHAGVIRAMRLWHQGITCPATAQDWPANAPDYGEWTVLRFNAAAGAT